jgi:hypothetical protein
MSDEPFMLSVLPHPILTDRFRWEISAGGVVQEFSRATYESKVSAQASGEQALQRLIDASRAQINPAKPL